MYYISLQSLDAQSSYSEVVSAYLPLFMLDELLLAVSWIVFVYMCCHYELNFITEFETVFVLLSCVHPL